MKFPDGFTGGAAEAGLKPSGALDLGVVWSETPCSAAGVFTTNRFAGANIALCRKNIAAGRLRGLVVHAGQANACTGERGAETARATLEAAARHLGCKPRELVLGSTGVIGVLPDIERIEHGFAQIAQSGLDAEGILRAGRAMMTTDLVRKTASGTCDINGHLVTISGMAKGSGMIHPNMGTMLAYLFTDARISRSALDAALRDAVDDSFHCLTVDGDTSTSDMVIALANGAAGNAEPKGTALDDFRACVRAVCRDLARQIAADGEGATRLVIVRVRNAATRQDAHQAAMAVAGSNLVKTAVFGRDPNWGRIACAIGYSGAEFDPANVVIRLGDTTIFAHGTPLPHERETLVAYLSDHREIELEIDLGAGEEKITAWTCDLGTEYIRINAEYTT